MKTSNFKQVINQHLNRLIGEWFEDNKLFQALAKTILQANINKFEGLLNMLTDENGEILIDVLVDNLGDMIENGYRIDLTTISPLLPNRILLVTKQDIRSIINDIKGGY